MFMIIKLDYENSCEDLEIYLKDYFSRHGLEVEIVELWSEGYDDDIEVSFYVLEKDCDEDDFDEEGGYGSFFLKLERKRYDFNTDILYGHYICYDQYFQKYEGEGLSNWQKKTNRLFDTLEKKIINKRGSKN